MGAISLLQPKPKNEVVSAKTITFAGQQFYLHNEAAGIFEKWAFLVDEKGKNLLKFVYNHLSEISRIGEVMLFTNNHTSQENLIKFDACVVDGRLAFQLSRLGVGKRGLSYLLNIDMHPEVGTGVWLSIVGQPAEQISETGKLLRRKVREIVRLLNKDAPRFSKEFSRVYLEVFEYAREKLGPDRPEPKPIAQKPQQLHEIRHLGITILVEHIYKDLNSITVMLPKDAEGMRKIAKTLENHAPAVAHAVEQIKANLPEFPDN